MAASGEIPWPPMGSFPWPPSGELSIVSTVMVNNLRPLSHTASLRADRKAVPDRSKGKAGDTRPSPSARPGPLASNAGERSDAYAEPRARLLAAKGQGNPNHCTMTVETGWIGHSLEAMDPTTHAAEGPPRYSG